VDILKVNVQKRIKWQNKRSNSTSGQKEIVSEYGVMEGGGGNGREVYKSGQRKITPGKVDSKGHLSEWQVLSKFSFQHCNGSK